MTAKKVVRIEVRGGVAEVTQAPKDVQVEVVDWDNVETARVTIYDNPNSGWGLYRDLPPGKESSLVLAVPGGGEVNIPRGEFMAMASAWQRENW